MKRVLARAMVQALMVILPLALAGCASTGQSGQGANQESATKLTAAEKQKKIDAAHNMKDETLERLFKEKPEVKAEIAKAVGYGVFDASQINIILFVGASGQGVLVDNQGGKETFMHMKRVGTGPGLGYKSYHQVIVFKSRKLFDQFRTVGADVGAGGDATAALGGRGVSLDGSVSFNPELSVYQFTDSGLLLQANWGGVAYLPDGDLNAP
jgi:lipid-binding SYLF domain-containing protein